MDSRHHDHDASQKFLSSWLWWLPPSLVALVLILVFADPFIGDWDALEYTIASLRGEPSSMALGRGLFIFFNHALYSLAHACFNVPAANAYLLFKYAVVAEAVLTVIAVWILARKLSTSAHSATVAALLLAFSPTFVIYGGQVMTDVPAMLLLTIALVVHLQGIKQRQVWLMMIGAAILGAGMNLRETIGLYSLWLILAPFTCGWRFRRREIALIIVSCLVFSIFAFGGFTYWFLTDPVYRAAWFGWRESMQIEAARHPASVKNVLPWLAFFFAAAPLVPALLPFAVISEWRRARLSPMLLLALLGLLANLLLLLNYSTSINWRYLLTGFVGLAPLVADFLNRLLNRLGSARRVVAAAGTVIAIISIALGIFLWPSKKAQAEVRAASRHYDVQLTQLPRDAVVIAGAQSVAVIYWRGVGYGDWEVIGPGAGWPESRLASVLASHLEHGKRVFVDIDPRWWQPCGWRVSEIEELVSLESAFHFRRVTTTIFEIRSDSDNSATDNPDLRKLLPENRKLEVQRCLN